MTIGPQPGLFIEETALHYHVEFAFNEGTSTSARVAGISAAMQAATSMRGPNTVWGISPTLWLDMAPEASPIEVCEFEGIEGTDGVSAPRTQSDLWFWCHGNAYEKVWRTAFDVVNALESVATVASQLSAFVGRDNRDPIGFIDGTENPALDEALAVSVIPEGERGAGGVPVLVQKWVHNLSAFEDLPVPEQEAVIGRTRADSTQLEDDVMPPTSHVSRNTILDADGEELHIFRRNTPFATVGEIGTLFIGCSADPSRIDTMLDRMFGVSGDGLTDHLTRYSTPVTGSYYFAPSMADLHRVFGDLAPDEAADIVADTDPNPTPSTGLGIGSLRET